MEVAKRTTPSLVAMEVLGLMPDSEHVSFKDVEIEIVVKREGKEVRRLKGNPSGASYEGVGMVVDTDKGQKLLFIGCSP